MVTDRMITVSGPRHKVTLTEPPYFVEKIKGFDTLDVNVVSTQGFDQDGTTVVNIYADKREMEISGQICASTTKKMQELRDGLLAVFTPKTELEIRHCYGGVARKIKVYAKKTPEFTFTKVSKVQNYKVKLVAENPYWSEDKDSVVEMANTIGVLHFPLTIPKADGCIFGVKSASKIASVPNRSAIKIGMKIVFTAKGTVSGPYVLNIYTRECIRLDCTMEAGQSVTVETGSNKAVTRRKSGVDEDYIGKVDLAGDKCDFLELSPGDNVFRYGADTGEEYIAVKFEYSEKYTGV